jgi:preprotein translocase subunit SecE
MPNIFQKTRAFWGETAGELKKASWPTSKELRGSTVIVIVSVLLVGFYVALSDFSVYNWVTLLTRWVKGV